ncbi:VOC family protein [Cucumibacter marinus]|uniref:VOC family protein n=1 Tax=Cucumibacter marinus TaxID=1121252 RepID=UPI0004132156|nr:VOC family protein [Cucumibacter marinus]
MPKITTCLWFNFNADEAIAHYLNVFGDGEILSESRYGDAGPGPSGKLMTASFRLFDQHFMALNAGPDFQFSPAISLFVDCADQAELDRYWDRMIAAGGTAGQCGWLTDAFGLSWQIIPRRLGELMGHSDPAIAGKAAAAMMQMQKIDIAALDAAVER